MKFPMILETESISQRPLPLPLPRGCLEIFSARQRLPECLRSYDMMDGGGDLPWIPRSERFPVGITYGSLESVEERSSRKPLPCSVIIYMDPATPAYICSSAVTCSAGHPDICQKPMRFYGKNS